MYQFDRVKTEDVGKKYKLLNWKQNMKTLSSILAFILCLCLATGAFAAEKYAIESLSPQQTEYVNMALETTRGSKILRTATVKSQNHARAYCVGAKFTAPGIKESMIAVWIFSGPKNKPGIVNSVNGSANQFSGFPLASKTKFQAYLSDKEYKILKKHLK